MPLDEDIDDALDEKPDDKEEKKPEDKKGIIDEEKKEDETSETTEDTEGGEGDLDKDEDEEEEEIETKPPSLITAAKKEFPNLAKKYPQLIDSYFENQEFKQVFGTVDDAKLAVEKSDVLDGLLGALETGDIEPTLDVMYERDPEGLQQLITNFLPTISKRSPQMFKEAVRPVIQNLLARIAQKAQSNRDEDLMTAVRYINREVFGSSDAPEPTKFEAARRAAAEGNDNKAEKVFYSAIEATIDPIIDKEILAGLDPDNAYPEGLREAALDKIKNRVFEILRSNEGHMRTMTALRKSAAANEYNREYQRKVSRAVINAAKEIIPSIRAKVKKSMIGEGKTERTRTGTPSVPSSNSRTASVDSGGKGSNKFDLKTDSIRDAMDKVLPS